MSTAGVQIKTLKIDGKDIGARENQTILEVALENGIYIPTLCHLEGHRPRYVEYKPSATLKATCLHRVKQVTLYHLEGHKPWSL